MWQKKPSFLDREEQFPNHPEKGVEEMEDVSSLKRWPLRGLSYSKTASTLPFSTGNTAVTHHDMCLFRNFTMLVPDRHLVSPKNIQTFFLLCHFQPYRLQQKFFLVTVCPTLHRALSCFIAFSLLQLKCVNSFCTIFWLFFMLILPSDLTWKINQYLLIFNGNSLTNIWNKSILRPNQKELATF